MKLYIDIIADSTKARQGFQQTGSGVSSLDAALKRSGVNLQEYKQQIDKISESYDRWMKRAMLTAGVAFAGMAYKAAEFSNAMGLVKAQIEDTPGEMQRLSSSVLEMRNGFGNAAENANAMFDALGSGLNAEESLSAVAEAAVYAKANVVDMSDAIDIGVVSLNTYGDEIGSFPELYDDFTTATILAKMRGQEFAASFGEIAAGAHLAGIKMNELLSYYISVTRGGLNAAEATVSLQNAIMQVATPSKDATAAAAKLGIEFNLAALQAKGFTKFFSEIAEKAGNNNQAIIDMFGSIRAFRGIAILTSETGMKNFNLGLKELADNAGASQEALQKLADGNIQFQATELYQGILNAAIKESLPMLEEMARYIAANREEIVIAFKGILDLAKAVGGAIILLAKAFVELRTPIQIIATTLITMWAVDKVMTFIQFVQKTVIVLQAARLAASGMAETTIQSWMSMEKQSGFMSASVSANFQKIAMVASTVAIAAAMAFRQATQMIIDDLDAQMAKMIESANTEKAIIEKMRLISREGNEAEKNTVKGYIDEVGKLRADAIKRDIEGAETLSRGLQVEYYKANKATFDAIATRIEKEREAESQIAEIKKTGSNEQKALLDRIISMYGNTRQAVIQVMGEYQKEEAIFTAGKQRQVEANEKLIESMGKLQDAIGLVSSESLEKEKVQVQALQQVWAANGQQITGNINIINTYLNELSKSMELLKRAGSAVPSWMKETAIELLNLKASMETVNFEVELMKENEIDAAISGNEYDTTLAGTVITQGKFSESLAETTEFIIAMQEEMKAGRLTIDDYFSGMNNIIESLEKIGVISDDISGALNNVFREAGNVFNLAAQGDKLWGTFNKIQAEIEKVKLFTPEATDKIKELTDLAEQAKPKFFDSLFTSITIATAAFSAFQSVISFIVDLFREDFHDAATEALGGLPGATGEMVDNLAEAAEKVGDINKAFTEMYAQLLKNANLINSMQFAQWTGAFADLVDHYITEINSAYQMFLFHFGTNTGEAGAMGTELQLELENLNAGFQQIITEAQRLGTEGSAAMLEIIQKARDLEAEGYRIQAVWDYVTGKITGAASGLELYLSSFGDTLAIQKEMNEVMAGYQKQIDDKQAEIDRVQKELDENKSDIEKSIAASGFQKDIESKQAEIDALREEYGKAKGKHRKEYISTEIEAKEKELAALEKELKKTGMQGTDEERAALEEKRLALEEEMNTYKTDMQLLISESNNMLTYYMNKLTTTRQDIVDNWDFIQGSVMATFNAFRAQGIPLLEIVTGRMKSQFDKIAKLAKDNGMEVTEGLKRLLNISDFGKNFETLSKQISGVFQMFTGLGDAGMFKGEAGARDFEKFKNKITSQFDDIIKKTGDTQLAYDLMGPSLQKLEQYAISYNLKLDPATQALIEQAKAAGAFAEVAKTDAEIMSGGFASVTDAVFLLVETLGGTVPDAMRKMVEQMKKDAGIVTDETVAAVQDANDKIGAVTGSQDAAAGVTDAAATIQASFVNVNLEIEKTGAYMSIQLVSAAEVMKAGTVSATDAMVAGFITAKAQVDNLITSMQIAFAMTAGALPGSPTVIPGYAKGTGGYVRNRTAIVGETGPELLHFSGTGDYMNITPLKGPGGERGGRVVPVVEEKRIKFDQHIKIDGNARTSIDAQVMRQFIKMFQSDIGGIATHFTKFVDKRVKML